jgi:hypothetical protein
MKILKNLSQKKYKYKKLLAKILVNLTTPWLKNRKFSNLILIKIKNLYNYLMINLKIQTLGLLLVKMNNY